MSSTLRQLGLLVWKNAKLQMRRKLGTCVEIGLPILFISILVALRTTTEDKWKCTEDGGCTYESFRLSDEGFQPLQGSGLSGDCPSFHVSYAPNTTAANQAVMARFAKLDNLNRETTKLIVRGFATEEEMLDSIAVLSTNFSAASVIPGCRAGVFFKESAGNNKFHFDIRLDSTPGGFDTDDKFSKTWMTKFTFPQFLGLGPRNDFNGDTPSDAGELPGYYQHNFIAVQHGVNRAIIDTIANSSVASTVMDNFVMERFPYPRYKDDPFVFAIQFGLPLLLMLALLYTALSIVRNVVHEKERKLKASMKMMGLATWVHWTAWLIEYFVFMLISMIIITLLMSVGKVLQHSDMSLIFVFLIFYALSTISFCFFLSSFFSRANIAAGATGIIWFVSYLPYSFISQRYQTMSLMAKRSSCTVPNVAMALGAYVIGVQEGSGAGTRWNNMAKPISSDDSFTFGTVLGMLLFDSLFYGVLTWYLEAVFPGEFGVAQPWYFFLTATYWCPNRGRNPEEEIPLMQANGSSGPTFEAEPRDLRCGVACTNLRKEFGTKVAVANTNINLYEGQITALLGHNGAGKTTTMNMLCGLYSPTSGSASIYGHDIATDIAGAQGKLGICPQHDVLFDTLTVEEHLWFFCRLKGVPKAEVQQHVDEMIEELQLPDKRHAQSQTLSGGMKRRLSCGIALVGGSKMCVLDEPTSGLDPSARRAVWDLLYRHKEGRTILLSTHFMDEADLLGDRIAIMSDGVVKCCGSSMFLKKVYGVGYHLTLAKLPSCKVDRVTNFISKYIPGTKMEGNVGTELTYLLPRSHVDNFADMFRELEDTHRDLGIESFGCSVTTMEEVFLKVGEGGVDDSEEPVDIQERIEALASRALQRQRLGYQAHVQSGASGKYQIAGASNGSSVVDTELEDGENGFGSEDTALLMPSDPRHYFNKDWALKIQQFKALVRKRFLHSLRNKRAVFTQLLPPLLFTLIALILTKTIPGPSDSPALSFMDLTHHYDETTVYFADTASSTSASNALSSGLADAFAKSFPSDPQLNLVKMKDGTTWSDARQFIIAKSEGVPEETANFNQHTPMTTTFVPDGDSVTVTAWFNGQPYHAIAESIALTANAIAQYFVEGSEIAASNYPLPRSANEEAKAEQDFSFGFTIAFTILFGMAPLGSSFVVFLVQERENKAKHVQFVSGVSSIAYWTATYLWDFINYLIPTFFCIVLFLAFQVENYAGERVGYVVALFVAYGIAVIPSMYIASFYFKDSSTAFLFLTMVNIVTGLGSLLSVSILNILHPSISVTLKKAFLVLPNFCFGQGLSDLYTSYEDHKLFDTCMSKVGDSAVCCEAIGQFLNECPPTAYGAWDEPGIGRYTVLMLVEAVFFFLIVLAIENRLFYNLREKISHAFFQGSVPVDHSQPTDEDVLAEQERVERVIRGQGSAEDNREDILLVNKLKKVWRTGTCGTGQSKLAVNELSIGVAKGECFGLLGVNGAGKSTTFAMLTGEVPMSDGSATLEGYDVATEIRPVRQRMGYCPQFDALIATLTVREVLELFAALRGMPDHMIHDEVVALTDGLYLNKHIDTQTQALSGGNKRKLSTAIALVGHPSLCCFDELSTGVDPAARRFLWQAVQSATDEGRAVVLTTHVMEEAEALCTRLGVMVDGQLRCLGSIQHLKSRFCTGLKLMLKVPAEDDTSQVIGFVGNRFGADNVQVVEQHQGLIQLRVENAKWSDVFVAMQEAKAVEELHLEDYSVAQPSLEDLFVQLSEQSRHADE